MKYSIQTKISKRFNANSGEFTKDHEPLPVKVETSLVKRSNLILEFPDAVTCLELKAEILKSFPDLTLSDLTLSANGSNLVDSDQASDSNLVFTATFGIDAAPAPEEPVTPIREQRLAAKMHARAAAAPGVASEPSTSAKAVDPKTLALKARFDEYLAKHIK